MRSIFLTLLSLAVAAVIFPAALFSESSPENPSPQKQGNNQIRDRLDFAAGLYSRNLYDMAAKEYQSILSDSPEADGIDDALFGIGHSFFFAGRHAEALIEFRKFERRFPGHAHFTLVQQRISECLYHTGEKEKARSQFTALLKTSAPEVQRAARYYLGKINYEEENWERSKEHFNKVTMDESENPFLDISLYYLGEIAFRQNKAGEARGFFMKTKDSQRAEISQLSFFGLGRVAFERGENSDAFEWFKRAYELKADPDVAEHAILNAIKALYNESDYEGVVKLFKSAGKEFQNPENNVEASLLAAYSYGSLNQPSEALSLYGLIGQSPQATETQIEKARLAKAEILIRSNQVDEGLVELEALIAGAKSVKDKALFLKAEALKQKKDYAQALAVLQTFMMEFKNSELFSQALLESGYLSLKTEAFDDARDLFFQFYDQFSGHALAPKVLGDAVLVSIKAENWQQAIKDSILFLERFPQAAGASGIRLRLASLYMETGEYLKAREVYTDYLRRKDPIPPDFYLQMGYNEQLAGNFEEAVTDYRRVEKKDVGEDIFYALLKNLAYSLIRLERFEDAAATYSQIIKEYPKNDLSQEVYFWLANYYSEASNAEGIRKVLEGFSKLPEAENFRGEIDFFTGESYRIEGDCRQAVAFYEKAYDANEVRRPQILIGKGLCLAQLEKFDEAQAAYDEGLKLTADDHFTAVKIRMKLGSLYEKKEDFLNAAKAYFAVAILYDDPDTVPDALFRAGEAFLKADKTEEARQAFRELIERYPNHQDVAAAKKLLQEKPA